MLPVNFNPSFSNLAALRGLGGMPHPLGPIGSPIMPVSPKIYQPPPAGMPVQPPMQMPGQMPVYSGAPAQATMQMPMQGQMPQGNLGNLHALMQLLGQR